VKIVIPGRAIAVGVIAELQVVGLRRSGDALTA
jgi:hypothetical protein